MGCGSMPTCFPFNSTTHCSLSHMISQSQKTIFSFNVSFLNCTLIVCLEKKRFLWACRIIPRDFVKQHWWVYFSPFYAAFNQNHLCFQGLQSYWHKIWEVSVFNFNGTKASRRKTFSQLALDVTNPAENPLPFVRGRIQICSSTRATDHSRDAVLLLWKTFFALQ